MEKLILDDANAVEFRKTPWDERVLGYPTNEILAIRYVTTGALRELLARFEKRCKDESVGLTISRIDAEDRDLKAAMQAFDYYLAEISFQISRNDLQECDFSAKSKLEADLQPAAADDFEQMRLIARDDFHFGRLMEDTRIDPQKGRERSYRWIDDLQSQGAEFWVIKTRGRVAGFHIQKVENQEADMILTGTARHASMLALPLWVAALNNLKARGIRKAHTLISAANVRVVNLYSHLGFKFEKSLLGMHKLRAQ